MRLPRRLAYVLCLFQQKEFIYFGILFCALIEPFLFPSQTQAVVATGYLRLDRMATSATGTATTGGTICMTPETAGTEAKVVITFPGNGTQSSSSFGVNSTAGNWTLVTTNIPSGSTQWPGVGSNPTSISGASVTVASSDLSTGTQYCFRFTGASTLSNPSSTGSNLTGTIVTEDSGNTPIDTINYATAIVSNDQISVTATVPSTFSFSLTGNSAALGTLTTLGPTSATVSATVSTNANNGYLAWVKSANAALNSAGTGDTIPSASYVNTSGNIVDLATSSEGYVLDVEPVSGSPTIATPYAGNNVSSGGNFDTIFEQIASKNTAVSNNQFSLNIRARPAATRKAGSDYSDTLTVTAAGQF